MSAGAAEVRSREFKKRPLITYMGGKWKIAPWVISHLPPHKIYVEPFGGAASVLLLKEPSLHEIYNDMDGELVNLFRVMRSHWPALRRRLELTPFARDEYDLAQAKVRDPVERAARSVVRVNMGFGARGLHHKTGWRGGCNISDRPEARGWANHVKAIEWIVERLRNVAIENRDAFELIRLHDCTDTLFYLDPPYLPGAGKVGHKEYLHDLDDGDHRRLVQLVRGLYGRVVLSGYPSRIYDAGLVGWSRARKTHHNQQRQATVERLWIKPEWKSPVAS